MKYMKLDYKMMSVLHSIPVCWVKLKVIWVKLNCKKNKYFYRFIFWGDHSDNVTVLRVPRVDTENTTVVIRDQQEGRAEGGRCKVPNHPPFEAEPHPPLHFLLSPPHQK